MIGILHIYNTKLLNFLINRYNIEFEDEYYIHKLPDNIIIILYKINLNLKIKNYRNRLELLITNNLFKTNYKSYYGNEVLADPCYFYNLLIKELILSMISTKITTISNKLKELYIYKYNIVRLLKFDFDKIDVEDYKNTNKLISKYNIEYNKLVYSYMKYI